MSDLWYCIISKIISVAGFVTLVIAGHPFWGLLCFLALATIDRKLGGK